MNKQALVDVISKSGGSQWAQDEADDLWVRIDCLDQTGRYRDLVLSLAKTNNRNNFLALVLEVNFAYQFESKGLDLAYEVQQSTKNKSSIDFRRNTPHGDSVYFELRLLQQALTITESIKAQLQKSPIYRLVLGGDDEQNEVVRLQNTILGKVQDKNGTPVKFFSASAEVVNIVVVDASESILGTIDLYDCMLATHGDPSVREEYRRDIFGLFQEPRQECSQRIHDLAAKYSYIRQTLHGVLFLFKQPNTGILAYRLEQYLMWNPVLIAPARAQSVLADLTRAIPVRLGR